MKRTHVLITGATGKLGRKLQRHLATACELSLLCLNPDHEPGVTTADLSRVDQQWTSRFEGVDVVLHLAAQSSPQAGWADVVPHNIDATLNVFEAAVRGGVGRVVFASSIWTMAGYRFGRERLGTTMPPRPTNPYGMSKLAGERIGRSYAARHGLSVLCLRLGYCPAGTNTAPPDGKPSWYYEKWLSDRDFYQLVERSMATPDVSYAVVNGVSNNAGMRWELDDGRRLLGYVPVDGSSAGTTTAARVREAAARLSHRWRSR